MEYATLGRSGLQVSQVCLGAMNFGSSRIASCDEAEATRIVDAYLEAGGNIIDIANAYSEGESEEIVGRIVKSRRASVLLATKGFMPQGPGRNDRGLSRVHLTQALDDSLRRLGTDYVDLYQCHQWDPMTPIEETMATLDGFVRAGKVRYLGCSNFTAAQIVEAQWAAERVGGTPFISLQPQYSLIARSIEAEILPAGERHGLGAIVWSPLGGGVLSGRYGAVGEPAADSRIGVLRASGIPMAQAWTEGLLNERTRGIAEEIGRIAAELDTTPAAVALSWLRRRPGVTSVIIGPRTLDQLRGSLAGFDLTLPAEVAERLDKLSDRGNLAPINGMDASR
jgi:aryl-alcohol dehydrogenase-like predicted oxidoreductase